VRKPCCYPRLATSPRAPCCARLLFAMGRTSQMAGYFPRAIEYFQAYLKEYPGGADRLAARFHLGESQRQFGQSLSARLTWADLVRDIERRQPFLRPDPPGAAEVQRGHRRLEGIPGLTHHNSESGLYGKFRIPSKPRLLPYSLATFR